MPLALQEVPPAMSRTPVGGLVPRMGAHIGMGLSFKVHSFLAMGVPVVAVRASVMESLVHDDEVLMFADGDHQDFADYLVRLHEDPEFGRQLSGRARRFTQGYVWEDEFGGYLQLLDRPGIAAGCRCAA